MKISLAYLPQRELQIITDLIVKEIKPNMIILYNKFTKRAWNDNDSNEKDILDKCYYNFEIIIIAEFNLTTEQGKIWEDIISKLVRIIHVNLIQLNFVFVSKFSVKKEFLEVIIREGMMLYETNGNWTLLFDSKPKLRITKINIAKDYNLSLENANKYFLDFTKAYGRGHFKNGALYLQKSTEEFYIAFLSVFIHYKLGYNIGRLADIAKSIDCRLKNIFPTTNKEEINKFNLLKNVPLHKKHTKNFRITKEDLAYLGGRVLLLRNIIEKICRQYLDI